MFDIRFNDTSWGVQDMQFVGLGSPGDRFELDETPLIVWMK